MGAYQRAWCAPTSGRRGKQAMELQLIKGIMDHVTDLPGFQIRYSTVEPEDAKPDDKLDGMAQRDPAQLNNNREL